MNLWRKRTLQTWSTTTNGLLKRTLLSRTWLGTTATVGVVMEVEPVGTRRLLWRSRGWISRESPVYGGYGRRFGYRKRSRVHGFVRCRYGRKNWWCNESWEGFWSFSKFKITLKKIGESHSLSSKMILRAKLDRLYSYIISGFGLGKQGWRIITSISLRQLGSFTKRVSMSCRWTFLLTFTKTN